MLWLSFHFERSLKTLQILLKHSFKVHKVNFLTSFIFLLNNDDTIHLLHECWRHIKIHSFKKKIIPRASPEKHLNFWEKSNILFFLDQFKTRRALTGFPTKKAKTLRVFDFYINFPIYFTYTCTSICSWIVNNSWSGFWHKTIKTFKVIYNLFMFIHVLCSSSTF